MRGLTENQRLRLLLLTMGVLQAGFLVVRAQPYGDSAHGLVAVLVVATAFATAAALLLPARIAARASEGLLRASLRRDRALALLAAVALVAGVVGVFTQQPFSWDERSVLWSAEVVADGGPASLFARYDENGWLGPQHPPLAPFAYGAVTAVLGSHLKLLRLVNLLFGIGTVLVAYLIGARLYHRRAALVGALLLLTSPLFARIASAATNDMPLTFLFVLALLLALKLAHEGSSTVAVLLGLVIGAGLLVKYTMVLVLPAIAGLAWALGETARLRRHAPVVLAIAFAMLLAWLDHAYSLGILTEQQSRLGNLARVATRYPGWAMDAIFTKTPSAVGVYVVPWLALGALVAWRRRIPADWAVACWVVAVAGPLLLTLPDNRYFLPAFPALTLLAARALVEREERVVPVVGLAFALCAITLAFYARIDLGQRMFLFG